MENRFIRADDVARELCKTAWQGRKPECALGRRRREGAAPANGRCVKQSEQWLRIRAPFGWFRLYAGILPEAFFLPTQDAARDILRYGRPPEFHVFRRLFLFSLQNRREDV